MTEHVQHILGIETVDVVLIDTVKRIILNIYINKNIFPCYIPSHTSDDVYIASPKDFTEDKIPSEYWHIDELGQTNGVTFDFVTSQGITFTFVISYKKRSSLYTFRSTLRFSQDLLKTGLIDIEYLIDLIKIYSAHMKISLATIRVYGSRNTSYSQFCIVESRKLKLSLASMFFFPSGWLDIIGREKFSNVNNYAVHKLQNGFLLVFRNFPFDSSNPNHISLEASTINELGLVDFIV